MTKVKQAHPRGVVAFSHGSGSGRNSPRNRFVAAELRMAGRRHAAARFADGGGGP